jgi:DNA adenine methylase
LIDVVSLNRKASFTSYSKQGFSDKDQVRLMELFKDLDETGAKLMLINSDHRNGTPHDTFLADPMSP